MSEMHPPAPSERSFGLSVGLVSMAFGAIGLWRAHTTLGTTLAVIGGLLVVFGLVAPSALRVPNRWWWRFAQALGWVNSRILLTLFFAVVFTPAGWVMRATGRSPLRAAGKGSNWVPYPARSRDRRHFEHSF